MTWLVRFRGKDFKGDEGWGPEFEHDVLTALTDKRELSGSAEIIFHLKDDFIDDVTVHESTNPDEFPFTAIHGNYKELGEVFIFSGVPEDGKGQLVALYSAEHWGEEPYNTRPYTGDGS